MAFNADALLNTSIESSMATERVLVPVGEHEVQCDEVTIDSGTGKESGKPWARLKLKCHALDANLKDDLGMDEVTLYDDFFLDLNEAADGLDFGTNRNVRLGELREAAGMNEDGEAFSLSDLKGATFGMVVDHRINKNTQKPYVVINGYYKIED